MKEQRGFTLVELMVVISIVALIMAWGIPAFSTWKQMHDVDSEMSQLYANLQFARMTAYSTKNLTGIYWGGGATTINQYSIVTNKNAGAATIDSGTSPLGATVSTAKYPISISSAQNSASFDGRGFLYTGDANDPAPQLTFSVSPDHGAGTDCVSVSLTMITLGKMSGGTCQPPK